MFYRLLKTHNYFFNPCVLPAAALLKGYCNSLMYFCMASRRCRTVVVGWYVGTLGIGICGTDKQQ